MKFLDVEKYTPIQKSHEAYLKELMEYCKDTPRHPSYHIHPPCGLVNDPNGLAYFGGKYHVFYQWFPFGPEHGMKHWAHVISKDLVKWEWSDQMLIPDQEYEKNGCYSGNSIEADGKLYLYYTANYKTEQGKIPKQAMAVMNSDGTILKSPNTEIYKYESPVGQYSNLLAQVTSMGSPDGLAQAFIIGEKFIGKDSACLVLGDNIFYGAGLNHMLHQAVVDAEQNNKATVFGYRVSDPERYGVAEFDEQGNCLSIEEKPEHPKSNYAVVGLYFYPNKVVEVAKNIKPSARGELEITTVNQEFLKDKQLKVQTMARGFAWLDTGTHDSLSEASTFIEVLEKRQGLKVACLEGIAYRQGWITAEQLRENAQPMLKNDYGKYLLSILEEKTQTLKKNLEY